jgi:hypothetical protein
LFYGAVAAHFQWGLTTSYGSSTPDSYVSPSADPYTDAAESFTLTNLQANTTYHFRIIVFNCSATTVGNDVQFTTSTPIQQSRPTVITSSATSIGANCATLNGTVNPNGNPNGTGYSFVYGTNTGYGLNTGTGSAGTGNSPVPVNFSICGLAPGTTYHYQLQAGGTAGTSLGADVTFTTLGTAPCVPPTVQTLAATTISSSYANLESLVNPNGTDTHLYYQWGTSVSYGNTLPPSSHPPTDIGSGNVSVQDASALNTGLSPGVTYNYRAVAYNSCGTNFGSNVVFTTTSLACPGVQTLSAFQITTNSAGLSGLINPGGVGASGLYQWGTDASFGHLLGPTYAGNGQGWQSFVTVLYNLQPYTTYDYRLCAYNNLGCTNYGTNILFTTLPLPPSVITGGASNVGFYGATLHATVNPNGPSALAWFEFGPTANNYGPPTGFSYLSPSTTAQSVSIQFEGLASGTQFHYRAAASNTGGTNYGSDQVFNTPQPWAVGSWSKINNFPYNSPGHMLLLPDGSVMVQNFGSTVWYGLSPDAHGHYLAGVWNQRSSMIDSRYYYGSQVLQNGKVLICGGEFGDSASGHSSEVYDPVANSWTPALGLSVGWADSETIMLANGQVLAEAVGFYNGSGTNTFLYDPVSNQWSPGPTINIYQDESTWLKLPDDSILTVDIWTGGTTSERYIPYGNTSAWVSDAGLPVALEGGGTETGGAFMLADGRAFWLGGSGHTALYTPSGSMSNGQWTQGPDMPYFSGSHLSWNGSNYVNANYAGLLVAQDTPAAMMNNGKILCQLSAGTDHSSTWFYECDPTAGGFLAAPCPTNSTPGTAFLPIIKKTDATSMVDLPDGTVLYNDGWNLYIYTPGTAALTAGRPTISNIVKNGDGSLHISGTLFNGISQGASYGDDAQQDTNFPLVRFTDGNGYVYYGRTYNWSSTGVQTGGRIVTTECKLPFYVAQTPGTYSVQVVANGNASLPVAVQFP